MAPNSKTGGPFTAAPSRLFETTTASSKLSLEYPSMRRQGTGATFGLRASNEPAASSPLVEPRHAQRSCRRQPAVRQQQHSASCRRGRRRQGLGLRKFCFSSRRGQIWRLTTPRWQHGAQHENGDRGEVDFSSRHARGPVLDPSRQPLWGLGAVGLHAPWGTPGAMRGPPWGGMGATGIGGTRAPPTGGAGPAGVFLGWREGATRRLSLTLRFLGGRHGWSGRRT